MGNKFTMPKLQRPQISQKAIQIIIMIILGMSVAAFILKLPMFPLMVINFGDFISTVIFLAYATLTWKYYESLPIQRKTVLSYLVQDLMLVFGSFRIMHMIRYFIISTGVLNDALMTGEYPNLTCSMISSVPYPVISQHLIGAVNSFQAFAKINPATYLSFNHEKARKITLVLIILLVIIEFVLVSLTYGTLCGKTDISFIQAFTGLQVDLKTTPKLGVWSAFLSCSPRLIYIWFERKEKKRNLALRGQLSTNTAGLLIPQENYTDSPEICFTNVIAIEESRADEDVDFAEALEAASSNTGANTGSISCRVPRNNIVAPEYMGTQKPYILDFNSTFIVSIVLIVIFLILVIFTSPEIWWISLYMVHLVTFIGMLYWLHSSEEISGYAMRKITQYFGDNI